MSEDIFHDDVLVTLIDSELGYVLLRDRKVALRDLADSLFFTPAAVYLTAPNGQHSFIIVTPVHVIYDLDRRGRVTLTIMAYLLFHRLLLGVLMPRLVLHGFAARLIVISNGFI